MELDATVIEGAPDAAAEPPTLPDLPREAPSAPDVPVLPDLGPAPAPRGRLRRAWDGVTGAATYATGCLGIGAGLAAIAAVPVLQLATLGWLLEAEGRVARTGSLRGALPGVDRATRVGATLLGLFVLSLPLQLLASYAADARLYDPAPDAPLPRALRRWTLAVGVATALLALGALAQGGGFLAFFRPIKSLRAVVGRLRAGPVLPRAWAAIQGFFSDLRLGHHVALGAMGLVAGLLWLGPPTVLLARASDAPILVPLGFLGLVVVIPWLVAGQAALAAEARFGAAFELRALRRRIHRAPLAHALATLVVLAAALPLYLLKIEPVPRDALWLPALFFVPAILPGRLLAGWAFARGAREGRAHLVLRLTGKLVALPAAAAYVFVVFFWQFFTAHGSADLFGQHAFLVPVAFY